MTWNAFDQLLLKKLLFSFISNAFMVVFLYQRLSRQVRLFSFCDFLWRHVVLWQLKEFQWFTSLEFLNRSDRKMPSLACAWLREFHVFSTDTMSQMDDDHKKVGNKARRLEQLLARKLAEFLDSRVTYSIRRVMAAEQQHLYVGMSTGRFKLSDVRPSLYLYVVICGITGSIGYVLKVFMLQQTSGIMFGN